VKGKWVSIGDRNSWPEMEEDGSPLIKNEDPIQFQDPTLCPRSFAFSSLPHDRAQIGIFLK
jgi:hypothetical protein